MGHINVVRRWLVMGIVFALALGCRDKDDGRSHNGLAEGTALDFTIELVHGGVFNAGSYIGSVVLVNFWDTWCGPCRQEQDDLNRLYADYHGDGFEIIGIALAHNGVTAVADYLTEYGVEYTSGLTGQSVVAMFGAIASIPKTFVITRSGELDSVHVGRLEYDNFVAMISPLLGN